eukprot:CCRYP_008072-RE/>CCRYP_008072-RE protein AED:0.22 eAED:0.22 QI:0/0.83/0.85/1/0.83/0.71/7/53/1353
MEREHGDENTVTPLEAYGNQPTLHDDHASREQRWGSIMAKMEVSVASTVPNPGGLMVHYRGGALASTSTSTSTPNNPYFSVLSAPGATIHSHSAVPPALGSTWKMRFREWIQRQRTSPTNEESEKKQFFERSVRILHSLVLKTIVTTIKAGKAEMEVAIHPNLITADNIVVHFSPDEGEAAYFIQTECREAFNLADLVTKYHAMSALGMIAYQLFTRGGGPPLSSCQPAVSDWVGHGRILCMDEHGDATENAAEGSNRLKRQRALGDDQCKINTTMIHSGVPYPLCRFVVDLIGGEGTDGLLFRSDSSFHSFADILSDLKQMTENPDAFIHMSIKDQWRLSFGEKMHGRESEKKVIMDVASRVSGTTSNDALFEALALLLPRNKQQIVMVTGKAGSGKTRLVVEVRKSLENLGWLFLSCKFDRIVHAEPLSVLASAFDEFLENNLRSSRHEKIAAALQKSMLLDDMSILSKHVPCITKYACDTLLASNNVEVSREQIHQLFIKLLGVLSVDGQPIAFFVDDLQWIDAASIDLFLALVNSSQLDLSSAGPHTSKKTKTLFIGSFRDNEVDDNHHVAQMLKKLKCTSSVEITDVAVCGFDQDTLNRIVSESLCLPLRKTKSLSEIILLKTDGIVIHIIEFIGRLTMEGILCHSFVRGWEWDSEVIESCPISESVAELFTFKLKKLPSDVLLGLKICSIFGTQIDPRIINLVHDFDGDKTVDINSVLSAASEHGLVESTGTTSMFKFSHDIIAQATFDLIPEEERSQLNQNLATALIKNALAAYEIDLVIFVIVDLISRIRNSDIIDPKTCVLYARMNEKAAKKALAVPDFSSAVKYSESGLSFLHDSHWETHHDLTLGLYQISVTALYSCTNGNQGLLKERIHAVFQNSKSLEEEFKTRHVWIRMLSTTSLEIAINECHILLERLGEPIDFSCDSFAHVCSEVVRVKGLFLERKQDFSKLTHMTDPKKLNAMKILSSLLVIYHHHQLAHIGFLASSRMVEMSVEFGYCEDSAFALASFAAVVVSILGDIDEGCSLARMALALVSKSRHTLNHSLPAVLSAVYGHVLVWKEPIQATLDRILHGCRLGFDYGNIEFAVHNAKMYVLRSFHCGKNINLLLHEIEVLSQKCSQHDQLSYAEIYLTPIYNVLRGLKGLNEQALPPLLQFISNDELKGRTMKEADQLCYRIQLSVEIVHSFILRNIEKCQSMIDVIKGGDMRERLTYNFVIVDFYAGLTACYLARKTREESWKENARIVRNKIERLVKHSEWNFENKFLLLKAECHYAEGEIDGAIGSYEAAVSSARDHKFVNEEAVACELAGYFFVEQGDEVKSKMMFTQAHDAYIKWGAIHKAKSLLQG